MTKEDRFLFTNQVDANEVYNTIDYKDAFNHIRALTDMEWNGKITLTHFRDRINDIITVISEKESGSVTFGELRKCKTWEDVDKLKQKKESK